MITLWVTLALFAIVIAVVVATPLLRAKRWWLGGSVIVMMPIVALVLYNFMGASQQLQAFQKMQREAKSIRAAMTQIHSPQQLITALRNHLSRHPNSAKGWYLLGQIYLHQQQFAAALTAMNKAHQLQPNNIDISLGYAHASFFAKHRRLDSPTRALLYKLVQDDPKDIDAINLLAIGAFADHRYQQAAQYWQTILSLVPNGSSDQKLLLQMIGRAQRALLTTTHKGDENGRNNR